MAHLASVGSHAINGVAALHSGPAQELTYSRLRRLWPEKFSEQDQRRDTAPLDGACRTRASRTASRSASADEWMRDLSLLRKLEPLAEDAEFRAEWRRSSTRTRRRWRGSSPNVPAWW
jgi:starch phosphorylase